MKRTEKSRFRDVLARNLRLMRAEHGWSQEALAAVACLNRTYLSAVELCVQNISLDAIWKIARALGRACESLH